MEKYIELLKLIKARIPNSEIRNGAANRKFLYFDEEDEAMGGTGAYEANVMEMAGRPDMVQTVIWFSNEGSEIDCGFDIKENLQETADSIYAWFVENLETPIVRAYRKVAEIRSSTDYWELGSTPAGEDCVQVNSDADYFTDMKKECEIYRKQLQRMFPDVRLGIKTFQHDFGPYCEVVVYFDDQNEIEMDKATEVENGLPENWDAEARAEREALNIKAMTATSIKKLGKRNAELISQGFRTLGYHMPDAYAYIEEELPVDGIQDIYDFMEWVVDNNTGYSANRGEELFKQFKTGSKVEAARKKKIPDYHQIAGMLDDFINRTYEKIKDRTGEEDSIPSGPDTSKFRSTRFGFITKMENEEMSAGSWSDYLIVNGIKIGTNADVNFREIYEGFDNYWQQLREKYGVVAGEYHGEPYKDLVVSLNGRPVWLWPAKTEGTAWRAFGYWVDERSHNPEQREMIYNKYIIASESIKECDSCHKGFEQSELETFDDMELCEDCMEIYQNEDAMLAIKGNNAKATKEEIQMVKDKYATHTDEQNGVAGYLLNDVEYAESEQEIYKVLSEVMGITEDRAEEFYKEYEEKRVELMHVHSDLRAKGEGKSSVIELFEHEDLICDLVSKYMGQVQAAEEKSKEEPENPIKHDKYKKDPGMIKVGDTVVVLENIEFAFEVMREDSPPFGFYVDWDGPTDLWLDEDRRMWLIHDTGKVDKDGMQVYKEYEVKKQIEAAARQRTCPYCGYYIIPIYNPDIDAYNCPECNGQWSR